MSENKNKNEEIARAHSGEDCENNSFKGYTIEEIRYQRAVVALQREFCKEKIYNQVNRLRKGGIMGGDKSHPAKNFLGLGGNVAKKVVNGLSYMDYALIAFQVVSSGAKFLKFFRKKK